MIPTWSLSTIFRWRLSRPSSCPPFFVFGLGAMGLLGRDKTHN